MLIRLLDYTKVPLRMTVAHRREKSLSGGVSWHKSLNWQNIASKQKQKHRRVRYIFARVVAPICSICIHRVIFVVSSAGQSCVILASHRLIAVMPDSESSRCNGAVYAFPGCNPSSSPAKLITGAAFRLQSLGLPNSTTECLPEYAR